MASHRQSDESIVDPGQEQPVAALFASQCCGANLVINSYRSPAKNKANGSEIDLIAQALLRSRNF